MFNEERKDVLESVRTEVEQLYKLCDPGTGYDRALDDVVGEINKLIRKCSVSVPSGVGPGYL